jgi:hypothetical protein
MNPSHRIFAAIVIVLVVIIGSCSRTDELPVDSGDEESNIELALNEQYDNVRNGARLILAYDAQSNSFRGTVENTTGETLKQVVVEVHLSNGKELGPSIPTDLAPGEKKEVELKAISTNFTAWTAHPEVGVSEGRSGEHERDGDSEHD